MTPILFYGVPEGCSFGSIVALEWIGKPYRLCRIQMPQVVSSDAYRKLNPIGETPSLMTDQGVVISESMAILNHIGARTINSGLAFAQGTPEFDELNQALAFLNTSFFEAFSPLWYALEHGAKGAEKNALNSFGRTKVEKAHADLERRLSDREWIAGNNKTLADAYFMGIARWTDFHKVVDRREFPRIQKLYERLQGDPGVRFAHAIEHQEPATSGGGFLGHVNLKVVSEGRQAA